MKICTEVIIPGREANFLYTLDIEETDSIATLFRNGAIEVTATISDGRTFRYTRVDNE